MHISTTLQPWWLPLWIVLLLAADAVNAWANFSTAAGTTTPLTVSTASYLQFSQPGFERAGMVYRPRFQPGCQLRQPPQVVFEGSASNRTNDTVRFDNRGGRASWTIALIAGADPWQAGCQSYKQIARAVAEAQQELKRRGWQPLGAILLASQSTDEHPAGPIDLFCSRTSAEDQPCSEPVISVSPDPTANLQAAGSVPMVFMSNAHGQTIQHWLDTIRDTTIIVSVAHESGAWNRFLVSNWFLAKNWIVFIFTLTLSIYCTYRLGRLTVQRQILWTPCTAMVLAIMVARIPFLIYYFRKLLDNHETTSLAIADIVLWLAFICCLRLWVQTLVLQHTLMYRAFDGLLIVYTLLCFISRVWEVAVSSKTAALQLVTLFRQSFFGMLVLICVGYGAASFTALVKRRTQGADTHDWKDIGHRMRRTKLAMCTASVVAYGVYDITEYYTRSSAFHSPSQFLALHVIGDLLVLLTQTVFLFVLGLEVIETAPAPDDAIADITFVQREEPATWQQPKHLQQMYSPDELDEDPYYPHDAYYDEESQVIQYPIQYDWNTPRDDTSMRGGSIISEASVYGRTQINDRHRYT